MTSVSFTLSALSHDNLLCSARLSILAITGVSDTIPPRLLLSAATQRRTEPEPRNLRRRAPTVPLHGLSWRQRQVRGAVTDARPNERGGLAATVQPTHLDIPSRHILSTAFLQLEATSSAFYIL